MKGLVSALACMLVVSAAFAPSASAGDRTVGEHVDDARITAAVKAKLTAERVKNLVNVGVNTRDGVVQLHGSVPTEEDKAEAERLARGAKGVRDVTNELRVEASETTPSASPRR